MDRSPAAKRAEEEGSAGSGAMRCDPSLRVTAVALERRGRDVTF